jgi:hypothetical protein
MPSLAWAFVTILATTWITSLFACFLKKQNADQYPFPRRFELEQVYESSGEQTCSPSSIFFTILRSLNVITFRGLSLGTGIRSNHREIDETTDSKLELPAVAWNTHVSIRATYDDFACRLYG